MKGEPRSLTLNVVVATFNRAELLRRTLQSLAVAAPAPSLKITVTVIDNNSTDETKNVVAECAAKFPHLDLGYLFEERQGKSFALNTALRKAEQDLIAIIDDDEEIATDWFVKVAELFGTRWHEIDFASGKMLPRWETEPPPAWASPKLRGITWRDYGDNEWVHDKQTPIVCGGHGIFKRSVFEEVGFYLEGVGVAGKNLMGCEDDVMYDKLIAAGKNGVYSPHLVIWHYAPDYRLTRNYFRHWCYGNGASQYLVDVYYKPFGGARVLGIPRYLYRSAAASLWNSVKARFSRRRAAAFIEEADFWIFCGYFYERKIKKSKLELPFRFFAKLIPSVAR